MRWLLWRQHRGEVLGAATVIALLGGLVLLHGVPMHQAYDQGGLAACHAMGVDISQRCQQLLIDFDVDYEGLPSQVTAWLPFLPMFVGMLVGAPLLAREFEQGTWQLAWTQGVTKRRWVRASMLPVLAGSIVAAVAVAALVTWWLRPLSPGDFAPEKFNHALVAFPAYVLFATALGICAGALVRRTIPAAAITVVGFLLVRVPVEFVLRPRYREPLTTTSGTGVDGWVVSDSSGPVGGVMRPGLAYHPADRFWQFQLIEASIFCVLAALLLLVAYRAVIGRRQRAPHETTSAQGEPSAAVP